MKGHILMLVVLQSTFGQEYDIPSNSVEQDDVKSAVNINRVIDKALPLIKKSLRKHNVDHLNLPELSQGFDYHPLLISYHGSLNLTNGKLFNVESIYRADHSLAQRTKSSIDVDAHLGLKDVTFTYDYAAKIMGVGPRGYVYGFISDVKFMVKLVVYLDSDEIELRSLDLKKIDDIGIKLGGYLLTDWIVNLLSWITASLFREILTDTVQYALYAMGQSTLEGITRADPGVVPRVREYLEKVPGLK